MVCKEIMLLLLMTVATYYMATIFLCALCPLFNPQNNSPRLCFTVPGVQLKNLRVRGVMEVVQSLELENDSDRSGI